MDQRVKFVAAMLEVERALSSSVNASESTGIRTICGKNATREAASRCGRSGRERERERLIRIRTLLVPMSSSFL